MNALHPGSIKQSSKHERRYRVLIGLVHNFLKTGKPIGSSTLKEAGFGDVSTATIRNYFSQLEEEGFLTQQHASGGRIPTNLAFRVYAKEYLESEAITPEHEQILHSLRTAETREIAAHLQLAAETLSRLTQTAVFLSAPRFDHDYVIEIKIVPIDARRVLCVIVTDFGMIKTEIIQTEAHLTAFAAKRLESYFHWRLTGLDKPDSLDEEEEALALKIYNEVMIRYIVNYSNFIDAELYRIGFSKLLAYPEFHDPTLLATTLGIFENSHNMRLLVKECCALNRLTFWIGDDLMPYATSTPKCAIVAVPYHINQNIAGAIGILGPTRIPYREIFGIMKGMSNSLSESLTRNLYKFKISFRQPNNETKALEKQGYPLLLLD